MDYLDRIGRQRPQAANPQEQMTQFEQIQRARLAAAEQLLAIATEKRSRLAAVQSKLDAMRVMALMGNAEMLKSLNAYCREVQGMDDKDLALLGRICQFGLAVDELSGGAKDNLPAILRELKSLVETEGNNPGIFMLTSQAAMVLEQTGSREQALEAYRAICGAFTNSKDPEVAAEARSLADRARVLELGLDARMRALMLGESGAAEALLGSLQQLLDVPSPGEFPFNVALQSGQLLEMAQQIPVAGQLYDLIEARYRDHANQELALQASQRVENGRKRVALVGQPLAVEGVLMDGTRFDWSQYQGKVVLVDFWATWCVPCLQEIPNIAQNYRLYREQGFEVVGINLDEDPAMIKEFLDFQPIPWPTVVTPDPTARGFQTPLARACGVDAIPLAILVGRDGKVIALHARGEELGKRLASLLQPVGGTPAAGNPAAAPALPGESPAAPAAPPAGNSPSEPKGDPAVEETSAPAADRAP